jgi:hypothetical protein
MALLALVPHHEIAIAHIKRLEHSHHLSPFTSPSVAFVELPRYKLETILQARLAKNIFTST